MDELLKEKGINNGYGGQSFKKRQRLIRQINEKVGHNSLHNFSHVK